MKILQNKKIIYLCNSLALFNPSIPDILNQYTISMQQDEFMCQKNSVSTNIWLNLNFGPYQSRKLVIAVHRLISIAFCQWQMLS